jgi:hypothetical protein
LVRSAQAQTVIALGLDDRTTGRIAQRSADVGKTETSAETRAFHVIGVTSISLPDLAGRLLKNQHALAMGWHRLLIRPCQSMSRI